MKKMAYNTTKSPQYPSIPCNKTKHHTNWLKLSWLCFCFPQLLKKKAVLCRRHSKLSINYHQLWLFPDLNSSQLYVKSYTFYFLVDSAFKHSLALFESFAQFFSFALICFPIHQTKVFLKHIFRTPFLTKNRFFHQVRQLSVQHCVLLGILEDFRGRQRHSVTRGE